jgi:hypothetical protein
MDITSQTKAITEHLMKGNGITSLGALHLYGCLRLSGRINDLRNRGMNILTEMIEVNGKRIAKYSFINN